MQTIWKYKVEAKQGQELILPEHSEILCVCEQNNEPHIWVLLDPDKPKTDKYTFYIYGTGHTIPDSFSTRQFVGTFFIKEGEQELVFHLFCKWESLDA